jgi:hypothetical protein
MSAARLRLFDAVRHPSLLLNAAACCCSFRPGNPEEGELRPQLLDRFGMHAQIGTVKEPELRVRIVAERSTFDEDPASEWQQASVVTH